MKEVFFEAHPAFIIVCLLIAIGYAALLYTTKHPWPKTLNKVLFSLRALLVFLLAFLLLSPIIKQIKNSFDKPVIVVLHDNSVSIKETTDSVFRNSLQERLRGLQQSLSERGYAVAKHDLSGIVDKERIEYNEVTSDLNGALRKVTNQYEGQSVAGVLLVSDGIYNTGLSPLYATYNFPIHVLGVGDTSQRKDVVLKDLIYNKVAYQGNKFPIRAEVMVKGFANESVAISLLHGGKVIDRQTRNVGAEQFLIFDFTPLASEQGIQRYDVVIDSKPEESNTRNNRSTAFIEVVEGKKKILMVASAPHPDVKAIRAVVEKNPNYDFFLHIPGVQEADAKFLQPQNIDLVIVHQVPDKRNRTRDLYQQFVKSKTSLFVIVGQQPDFSSVVHESVPLKFEQPPRQYDDVTPVVNTSFLNFQISSEANTVFGGFPPVWVPFAKVLIPASASVLLQQRIGSVATERPLLWVDAQDNRKVAVLLADGFWKWRLQEFSKSENTETFDEVFGKLIQYLSTVEDKSKFRSYPIAQQFSETEAVVFESQVYNDIYEPVYGNVIKLEITDELGKKYQYSYVTSAGNARYQIGGLTEGVYKYKSITEINGKSAEVRGQFLVSAQQAELQNLTADFNLLRKLSMATGGNFYTINNFDKAEQQLTTREATATIRTEERYDALLNLKWVFFILLVLVSAEWFLRKYFGSY
jgi:hypothetical protein